MQSLTTRPWITSGIAVVGAGLIAVAPVAPHSTTDLHLPDVQLTAFDPFGAWIDLFNTSSANAETLADTYFLAPGAVLQQILVNQFGYLGDILNNPASIFDVFSNIGDNIGNVFGDLTLLGAEFDLEDWSTLAPLAQANDTMHSLMTLAFPDIMGADMDPETLAIVTEVLNFLASPLTGALIGALGPVLSPLVEFGNVVGDIVADLGEDPSAALQDLFDLPARVIGSFFNGSDLDLSFLIPLIADAGILPEGITIDALGLSLGGLLTPGQTILPIGADVTETVESGENLFIGGSLWNALSLNVIGIDIVGNAVGPIGSMVALSQIIAGAIGWEGGTNPLADLSFPILDWFDGGEAVPA
ncbi:outer membrane porin GjpA [Mycolicibacter hiberniae]|uniref:Uncharacterized protein n=1 Tax=Mycolicibacter hiberniae TaxID=29314 RepID=A0A7I7X4W2_9MYCO|nr:outer membrane porin GjpA [Mycolicibacter hiberniae]MCV7088001.1 outer membrane porin GjpA [Mycolicibacter hiberniae]ORV66199.1 hypothetical protein AWC09_01585 [Mycolicibacter hiberniae]BBZ23741.1 hypothetical protein MHIB_21590 [Mycolicibacter hiberniae]